MVLGLLGIVTWMAPMAVLALSLAILCINDAQGSLMSLEAGAHPLPS